MPSNKKPTVALFTSTCGHISIAEAIRQEIEPYTNIAYYKEIDALFNFYTPLYQLFPGGTRIPFKISSNKTAGKTLYKFFEMKYESQVEKFFITHQPSLCISTFFMFNPVIAKLSKIVNTPFINVIPDPRTFHPLTIDPDADVTYAFDQQEQEEINNLYPSLPVQSVGWFVRTEFEEAYNKSRLRKELGLQQHGQVFLIASGSEGTTTIMKILPAILDNKEKIQIIVACGDNTLLYNSVRALQKVAHKVGYNEIIPLEFTTEMHKYMQAADLVIGKAGPNTLFESVATKTPFMAITHIAGQEDGNLDIIEEYKLGFVEENPLKASRLLRSLIRKPQEYEDLQPFIAKMARYNKNSKQELRKRVTGLLDISL